MPRNKALEAIRRPQIIEAALSLIARQGSHNVTLDNIALEAGLSKGGVAHYFSTKESLIREAFKEFFDRIFLRGRDTMNQFQDPLDKLLSFSWLFNWDDSDAKLGYRLLYDFMALASQDEDYRNLFHDWVENWLDLLKSALDEGTAQGKFDIADTDSTARTISAIYHGIAIRWYLDREYHSTEWAHHYCNLAITRLLSDRI